LSPRLKLRGVIVLLPTSTEKKTNIGIDYTKFNIVVSLLFASIFNARIWYVYFQHNSVIDISSFFQAIFFLFFLFSIFLFVFSIFGFRWLHKLVLVVCLLISAPAMYFSVNYGTLYDFTMIQNVLGTDSQESQELMSNQLLLMIIGLGFIPSIIVLRLKVEYPSIFEASYKNVLTAFFAILIGLFSVFPFYNEFNSFVRSNNVILRYSLLPISPLRVLFKSVSPFLNKKPVEKILLDKNASITDANIGPFTRPLALVVIIGETARDKSFRLQDEGLRSQEETLLNRHNLFYFSNFWSCGTSTLQSVPCMFSIFPRAEYDPIMNWKFENVAELIQRVGYSTSWTNNNSSCKDVCKNLESKPIIKKDAIQFVQDEQFYDEALVYDLAKRIRKKDQDQVIFLHQIGSHGPAYFRRSPDSYKILQPVCESIDFVNCERSEIRNAYNNTILYTKTVIGKAIEQLKEINNQYATLLIYVSDHGESTGEKGLYLHGTPYYIAPDEQTHIPAMFWMNEHYINDRGIDKSCLSAKLENRFSHDNFSHTLIGILDIKTSHYKKALDILASCRRS